MIDTGATTSLISRFVLDGISHPSIEHINTIATLEDGHTKIPVGDTVELPIDINGVITNMTMLIVKPLSMSLILGIDWCQLNNVNVNMENKYFEINHPKHGSTTILFLNDKASDVCISELIVLLPFHEHVVQVHTPIPSANVACL